MTDDREKRFEAAAKSIREAKELARKAVEAARRARIWSGIALMIALMILAFSVYSVIFEGGK